MGEWNRYALRNMPRRTRHWIIMQDVKNEVAFVQDCTKLALETEPLDAPKDFDSVDDDFSF